MTKNVTLKMKEDPTFECSTCGYQDYMGNIAHCPVCDPEGNEEDMEKFCFFFEGDTKLCRQDGKSCPFSESRKWEDCPKLEGLARNNE